MATNNPEAVPLSWVNHLPEFELYQAYSSTIESRFKAFGLRTFQETAESFSQPLRFYDPAKELDQNLVDLIVTRASHDRFTTDLEAFEKDKGLQSWRDYEGSIVYVTDHGMFTDVPVTAESLGRINEHNRPLTTQAVSMMISQIDLDIGIGPEPVIETLQAISNVAQTLPRLDGNPSDNLEEYRTNRNYAGKSVIKRIVETKGTTTVMSLIGRHNVESKNKKKLYIHEPNRKSLEFLMDTNIKVIPIYINCPTFGDNGEIIPAEMTYEIFEPLKIENLKRDSKQIVTMFREATKRAVGHKYPSGIQIRSWKQQKGIRGARRVQAVITHANQDVTSHY